VKEIITDVDALRQISTEAEIENGVATQETVDVIRELVGSIPSPSEALGLSAPQIGIFKRIFIGRVRNSMFAFVNPKISSSLEWFPSTEGCLSLPDIQKTVCRQREAYVTASVIYEIRDNHFGNDTIVKYEGTWDVKDRDAAVVQHETDHLDGVLITDLQEVEPPPSPAVPGLDYLRIPDKVLHKIRKRKDKIQQKRQKGKVDKRNNAIKDLLSKKQNPKKKMKADKRLKAARKRLKKRVELQEQIAALKKDAEDE